MDTEGGGGGTDTGEGERWSERERGFRGREGSEGSGRREKGERNTCGLPLPLYMVDTPTVDLTVGY